MSRGYLLFALNANEDGKRQYSKLAYACALSIRATQSPGYDNVSVVTNDVEAFANYKNVFDNIIEYSGPAGMDARSRALDYAPYDETVLLDADMLFLKPMDHYWDILKDRDLFVTTSPQTYKGNTFQYGFYRQVMEKHSWPDVYNAWTYFKPASAMAIEFFDLVKFITDNPRQYVNMFLSDTLYTTVPTDEAFAMALCILDLYEYACPRGWDFPRITHMKPAVQQWKESVADWPDKIRFSLTDNLEVKLGVWSQSELLHYVKKELITPKVIEQLEKHYDARLLSSI